jgi:hypothetical protein
MKTLLIECLKHVVVVNHMAEAKHDDPNGEYYMDHGQYEIMQETQKLIDKINELLKGDMEKIKILTMVDDDMRNDAINFDGKPFNGRTVAEYFGNQGAAISALAAIIKSILEEK